MTIGDGSSPDLAGARLRRRRGHVALVLVVACLGWSARARAQDGPTQGEVRRDSHEVGFVQLLLDLGLPTEAGREARRLVTKRGASALPPAVGFHVGMALALVGEADAATSFLGDAAAAGESATGERWQLATGVVMLRAGTVPQALHLFTRVETFTSDPVVRVQAQRLGCIGVVLAGDAAAARTCIGRHGLKSASAEELDQLVAPLRIDPERRAIVGGVLSGIIPGLGQLTAGHAGDGALALIVNSASVAGVTLLVLDGAILDAALLGMGVSLRYYLGNINNGAEAWRAQAESRRHEAARRLVARIGAR